MNDDTPFGSALAADVADLLERGGRVLSGWNAHWMVKAGDRYTHEVLKGARRAVFATADKAAFAAWLAQQSARSLDDAVRPGCPDSVEPITPEVLAEAIAANFGVRDRTLYGERLANAVADALDRGVAIAHGHRDYCGMGLVRRAEGYVHAPVFDGEVLDGDVQDGETFATRAAFVAWLAAQSDESLSGRDAPASFDYDNQRITRARLIEAIGGGTA